MRDSWIQSSRWVGGMPPRPQSRRELSVRCDVTGFLGGPRMGRLSWRGPGCTGGSFREGQAGRFHRRPPRRHGACLLSVELEPSMPLTMPFQSGDLVVVVLHSPRERVWGCLLGLDTAGIALRGLELTPWEEVLTLVRTEQADQVALGTRFLPM